MSSSPLADPEHRPDSSDGEQRQSQNDAPRTSARPATPPTESTDDGTLFANDTSEPSHLHNVEDVTRRKALWHAEMARPTAPHNEAPSRPESALACEENVVDLTNDSTSDERGDECRKSPATVSSKKRMGSPLAASNLASSGILIGFIVGTICIVLLVWIDQSDHTSLQQGNSTIPLSNTAIRRDLQQQHHQRKRRLFSVSAINNECQTQRRRPSREPVPLTYFATYPGTGSRVLRTLILALTGLRTANEHDFERGTRSIVAVQTRFPHKSGHLVEWADGEIDRAIVLIRNPMMAIASLFDELFESKMHLPARFHAGLQKRQTENARASSMADWISWRDRMFESQLASYQEFIQFWMKRYHYEKLLVISHEDLLDVQIGGDEARRLASFLGEVEGVNAVDSDHVPCVWDKVLNYKGDSGENVDVDVELVERRRRLDSYIIPHPRSVQKDGSTERPYTTEQIDAMTSVLQALASEFQHSHLHDLMLRYSEQLIKESSSIDPSNQTKQRQIPQQLVSKTTPGTTTDGRTFHIFHASPPNAVSHVVTHWLMGLFEEADADVSELVSSPGLTVYQNNQPVNIASTVVTRTNEGVDLLLLYKIFKPGFDEVLFVVSGNEEYLGQANSREMCSYDNVLCIRDGTLSHDGKANLPELVNNLTEQLRQKFAFFFGTTGEFAMINEVDAVVRLQAKLNAPRGAVKANDGEIGTKIQRRLFYCGSTGPHDNRRDSIYGIFLVNSFFPEIVGGAPENTAGRGAAIKLTERTFHDATSNDFLVYHMHQHCDVDVIQFPGLQLHVNVSPRVALHLRRRIPFTNSSCLSFRKQAEYYDLHPGHELNVDGRYTFDYIPQHENVFVLGAHEDGPRSIQLPYALMRWWSWAKGGRSEVDATFIEKFFDRSSKPKNTKKNFLLYANSHFVEYRERAANALSSIAPIHVLGKCQGNPDLIPNMERYWSPQCQPYVEDQRPSSVVVRDGGNAFDKSIFREYRFVLLMENIYSAGYITEKIIEGFLAGTIPIYYGSTQVFGIFNPNAFVFYDIQNPQKSLEQISYLESNPKEYERMLNQPILADGDWTIQKYFSFEDSVGNGILKKRVREKLGFAV